MRAIADRVLRKSIADVLPDVAVSRALQDRELSGDIYLIAIGKAAWRMAHAAQQALGDRITDGVVVTKYGHSEGDLGLLACMESGHPVPDENSLRGAEAALELVAKTKPGDTVLLLVSGGASALFEKPMVSLESTARITSQLLAAGADIKQINAVRKHLSQVKGGKFARACLPARVFQIVLSDVVGNQLDVIASGPAAADSSTSADALSVCERFDVSLSAAERDALSEETPKQLSNVETVIAGGVETLCEAASRACLVEGFVPRIMTTSLTCEAREAGESIAEAARSFYERGVRNAAFIYGGETVVHVSGTGLGGRSQELALSAARHLCGIPNISVLAFGSDGTDGPTDAAGGFVDGTTWDAIQHAGIDPNFALKDNDAYHALEAVGSLVKTGPTGTNVNDAVIVFIGDSGA